MASKQLIQPATQDLEDMRLLEEVLSEAGEIAMTFFQSSNEVWMKSGNSPVSEADHAVNDFLLEKLMKARPDYGWLSEESVDDQTRVGSQRTFVVDPIDGTRGFIAGRREWCVSVAVVEEHRPVVGVLRAPKLDQTYVAAREVETRLNGQVICASSPDRICKVAGSKKLNQIMTEKYGAKLQIGEYIPSLAMRVAYVASGELDVAVARSGAHDWDLAAADLILAQAGGILVDIEGRNLSYNKHNLRAPALLASGLSTEKQARQLAKSGRFLH